MAEETKTTMRQGVCKSSVVKPLLLLISVGVVSCGGGGSGGNSNGIPLTNNLPPVATNDCKTTSLNTTITGDLKQLVADPDHTDNQLAFSIPNGTTLKGTATTDPAGNFSYTPNPNARGADTFIYRVVDPAGAEASGTVKVNIDKTRIMPLGDSITVGFFTGGPAAGQETGYRKKLYDDLVAAGYAIDFVGNQQAGSAATVDRDHEGHGGFRDDQIASGITTWLNTKPADVILLHIGTNGINDPGGTSHNEVQSILSNIDSWETINHPVTVFLARIIGSPDFTTDGSINTFNNNVENNVANPRIGNGDKLFKVNQQTGAGIVYSSEMADSLHPNQSGYDKMANKWKADLIASGVIPNCP